MDAFEGGIYKVDEKELNRLRFVGLKKYDGLPSGH